MNLHRFDWPKMARSAAVTIAASLAAASIVSAAHAKSTLVVYSSSEADSVAKFAEGFSKDHPDIELNWIRDSTGVITAKLLAEQDNPTGDVIFGLTAPHFIPLINSGLVLPYTPPNFDQLDSRFSMPPMMTGMYGYTDSVCFNTIEAEKLGLPRPKTWKDLANPVYKDHIAMPHPASSGTGYMMVYLWLQLFGQEKGWEYMDALHENVSLYTHSSSTPCRMAAQGEIAIGLSSDVRGAQLKADGAPIDLLATEDGIGWESVGMAILKSTKNLEAAKTLIDWGASRSAMEIYGKMYTLTAMPGVGDIPEQLPGQTLKLLYSVDQEWAGENRDKILAEWEKRYGSKAEPK